MSFGKSVVLTLALVSMISVATVARSEEMSATDSRIAEGCIAAYLQKATHRGQRDFVLMLAGSGVLFIGGAIAAASPVVIPVAASATATVALLGGMSGVTVMTLSPDSIMEHFYDNKFAHQAEALSRAYTRTLTPWFIKRFARSSKLTREEVEAHQQLIADIMVEGDERGVFCADGKVLNPLKMIRWIESHPGFKHAIAE